MTLKTVHFKIPAVQPAKPWSWSKTFYYGQPPGYFWSLTGMMDMIINKRKILIVVGIAVAVVIAVYTGVFGVAV